MPNKERRKWGPLVRSLEYSGGTACDVKWDSRLLVAGYKVLRVCVEQVTYLDMKNDYRLNVRERSFNNLTSNIAIASNIAIDITRSDWATAFAETELPALGRKADLSGVQLLPHVKDLVMQMMLVSWAVLYAQVTSAAQAA